MTNKSIKKTIGYLLIIISVTGVLSFAIIAEGLKNVLISLGVTIGFVLLIMLIIWLIDPE